MLYVDTCVWVHRGLDFHRTGFVIVILFSACHKLGHDANPVHSIPRCANQLYVHFIHRAWDTFYHALLCFLSFHFN